MSKHKSYDPDCSRCPRLVSHLNGVRRDHPEYHCGPVAPFGDPNTALLIVGLAPGMHGANATGRPFTGDYAGMLLYETLHKFGFSNREKSLHRADGLVLNQCRITNAVKCLPPGNKPTPAEMASCNSYLKAELDCMRSDALVLALGTIAHQAILRAKALRARDYRFSHGAEHRLDGGGWLFDSYHCSRYNTQTRRLTEQMFHAVFARIRSKIMPLPTRRRIGQ